MKYSLNWLKEFVSISISPEELAEKLTVAGLEVEELINIGHDISKVITCKIISIEKHPDADKLNICQLSDGKQTHQIVTGAANIKLDAIVPVSLPGATLANGLKIKPTKLRGVPSNGMICSEQELGLKEDSEGIWLLPDETPIGIDFLDYIQLKDTLLDINILPNRGDCQSIYGLAREISALLNKPLKDPKINLKKISKTSKPKITIKNTKDCPAYTGRVIKGVSRPHSPLWMQRRLEISGIRPLDIIVDITNYVLLELGQPLHAFDLEDIADTTIIVRTAKKNEVFQTLDDQKHNLKPHTLVISDSKKSLALAGIMGGKNSEINDNTTNLLLESAYFSPQLIRKDQNLYNARTESAIRFEKGVDIQGIKRASDRASYLIQTLTNPSEICEIASSEDKKQPIFKTTSIPFEHSKINQFLGTDWSKADMIKIITNLGFKLSPSKTSVTVPSWRQHDIKTLSGLSEEIARIKGYDNINETLPTKQIPLDKTSILSTLKSDAETIFIQAGYSQTTTFPMISEKDAKTCKFKVDTQLKLQNPLTPEEALMRPSLLPSLLKVLKYNNNRQQHDLKLFEIGKVFTTDPKIADPIESQQLTALIIGSVEDQIFRKSDEEKNQITLNYLKSLTTKLIQGPALRKFTESTIKKDYLHPKKAVSYTLDNQTVAECGFIHPLIGNDYDVNQSIGYISINLSSLSTCNQEPIIYKDIPRFPSTKRDIALLVPRTLSYQEVYDVLTKYKPKLATSIKLFDEFESEKLGKDKKSLAFSVTYQDPNQTLSDDQINKNHEKFCKFITQQLPISIR